MFDDELAKFKRIQALMFWKLAFANPNVAMGLVPVPTPSLEPATADSWEIKPVIEQYAETIVYQRLLTSREMNRLMIGHIPDCQEDHWFMYCDGQNFRIYRSWSGNCVFDASITQDKNGGGTITSLTINKALSQFGVNGTLSAKALFEYLLISLIGGDQKKAWEAYLEKWKEIAYNRGEAQFKGQS